MNHLLAQFARFQDVYPHLGGIGVCLLKSAAILLMAAGAARLLQQRSARLRNWIWRCAMMGLLGLALWQGIPNDRKPGILTFRTATVTAPVAAPNSAPPVSKDAGLMSLSAGRSAESPAPASLADLAERIVAPLWMTIAAVLVVAHLLRSLIGSVWLRRHSRKVDMDLGGHRLGPPDGLTVRISSIPHTPLLAGWFRPAIYLPADAADWSFEKRRCVLLHEMAHWSRGDVWWQFSGTLACSLWWWNPLAWMALARLKSEAEQAADDAVILHGRAPGDYARLLVEIASGHPRLAPVGIAMLGQSPLEQRIRSILSGNPLRNKIGGWGASLLGALTAFIILCAGTNVVLGELDLTDSHGESVLFQADPVNNALPQGDFHKADSKLDGWTGALSSVTSPERGMIRLKSGRDPAMIEAVLKRRPDWEWITIMVRTRLAPGTSLDEDQEAGISFTQQDGAGQTTAAPLILHETNRNGYANWISRIQSLRLAPGTKTLIVQAQLTPGAGQLDCSEIYVIPAKPEDELDHRLVDRFYEALGGGDIKTVREMLDAEPRLVEARNGSADNGTPLILCAWRDMPEMAQLLIDHGANLTALDSNWKATALAWCGWWGSPKTAQILLNAGADPNFKSIYGVTPLSSAKAGKKANGASKATPEKYDQVIALFAKSIR